ncbi:MAG: helix-turn-helix transcriptional regulator [Bacilli bacterium]|nr:helix-turn-helix transcriptional regulator [Bacilli bacterium]
MKNETIGTIIKKIRKDNNLSQQQLSEILGLNNSTISKWEHDLIVPDISYLMIISDKFNIPLDKLISGELKPQKKPKKGLIMCMIILIETIIIISLSIMNYQNKITVYKLATKDNLIINGIAIKQNKNIYFNINKIEYINESTGTNLETIPENITITVEINEKVIINKLIENTNNSKIEELLSNITLEFHGKYKEKDSITINISIQEKETTKKISSKINLITNHDYIEK